jgi:hypothetical protein
MADVVIDGYVRVYYVPTIATLAAPTTTELNAGTNLTSFLIPSGLEGFDPQQDSVDNTSMASTFNTVLPGRVGMSVGGLIFKKQDGTDTVYNLLTPGTAGFIVVRANGVLTGTAWASSQGPLSIYPGKTGESYRVGVGEANSLERFRTPWFISAQPTFRAVVA